MEDHMSKHIPEAPIASRSEKGPGDHHEIASDTTHMKHPDRSEVGAAPARQLCAGQNPGPNEVPDGAGLFFLNPPFLLRVRKTHDLLPPRTCSAWFWAARRSISRR